MPQSTVTITTDDRDKALAEGASQLGIPPEQAEVKTLGEGKYEVCPKGVPGKVELVVQPDKMAAFIKLITPPEEGGAAVTVDNILDELDAKKVTAGVDHKLVAKVVDEVAKTGKPQNNICIAKGEDVKKGEDACIEIKTGKEALNKDPELADIVKPGQVLAVKTPAGPGAAGQNVLGEEEPAQPGADRDFKAGSNVTLDKDGVSFISSIYGRATPKRDSVDVVHLVEESEDNMSATMPIYPVVSDNSRLSLEDVQLTLKEAGIVYGLREEAIKEALQQDAPQSQVLVAQGTPAKDGVDARIEFGFRMNNADPTAIDEARRKGELEETAIVKEAVTPGTVLAKKIPMVSALEGRTVLGESLPATEAVDKDISPGEGVTFLNDGLTLVVAEDVIVGYADYADGSVFVEQPMRVSDDDMQVFLNVQPFTKKGKSLTEELVDKLLAHHKITHGISKKTIQRALAHASEKKKPLFDVIIANGTPPERGQDASFVFKISTDKAAGALSGKAGRMNFRERGFIHNVKKGDLLAAKIPAEPGVEGQDVHERSIPAEDGEDKALSLLGNVSVSEDGVTYTAEIDGMFSVVDDETIGVFKQYEIDGDVDYSIGNLSMDGSLDIKGWVKTGFTVKAKGDILVGEGVEDAMVEAGANIDINGGIVGIEHGKVKARGDIHAQFLERADVCAGGDIFIKDEIMRSKVVAGGRLFVTEGKGKIRGGRVSAINGIEAIEIGSEANVKTLVMAGTNMAVQRRLAIVKKQRLEYHRKVAKTDKILGRYTGKGKKAKVPKDMARKLSLLAKKRRELVRAETILAKAQKELTQELSKIDINTIRIKVQSAVYIGTTMAIGGKIYKVKEDMRRPVTFGLNDKGQVDLLQDNSDMEETSDERQQSEGQGNNAISGEDHQKGGDH